MMEGREVARRVAQEQDHPRVAEHLANVAGHQEELALATAALHENLYPDHPPLGKGYDETTAGLDSNWGQAKGYLASEWALRQVYRHAKAIDRRHVTGCLRVAKFLSGVGGHHGPLEGYHRVEAANHAAFLSRMAKSFGGGADTAGAGTAGESARDGIKALKSILALPCGPDALRALLGSLSEAELRHAGVAPFARFERLGAAYKRLEREYRRQGGG
jgi:hypothetical protein